MKTALVLRCTEYCKHIASYAQQIESFVTSQGLGFRCATGESVSEVLAGGGVMLDIDESSKAARISYSKFDGDEDVLDTCFLTGDDSPIVTMVRNFLLSYVISPMTVGEFRDREGTIRINGKEISVHLHCRDTGREDIPNKEELISGVADLLEERDVNTINAVEHWNKPRRTFMWLFD